MTFLVDHPLASAESISARDLEGLHILAHGAQDSGWIYADRIIISVACPENKQDMKKIFKAAGCMEEQ